MRQRTLWNCLFGAALGIVLAGGNCPAAFTSNFESDTVGAPPAGWIITGTNGTTSTANVASESGNQFLAIRDFDAGLAANARHNDQREKSGFLQFDIRFNQGVFSPSGAAFLVGLLGNTDGNPNNSFFEPVRLEFLHPFGNTNLPMTLRIQGDGFTTVTNDFPIGSWQTIRVDFYSAGNGVPRGFYTFTWDGITTNGFYNDQGQANLFIGALQFGGFSFFPSDEYSVDIDNVQFIPEPGAAALFLGAVMCVLRRRRKQK
jgi:hypothetical protein